MARTALWNVGLDYLHGTGHGVGSFLNVHEGSGMLRGHAGGGRVLGQQWGHRSKVNGVGP